MPSDRWWLLPVGVLVVGLLATIPFWTSDLDVRVAAAIRDWNQAQGGQVHDRWWWRLAYLVPVALSLAIGLTTVGILAWTVVRSNLAHLRRPAAYVLLVFALGSGVITNAVLKDHWGRPRPRDTVGLGGSWEYQAPWVKGTAGRGKSFPCGHATVPAVGFALFLLWRRGRPALARWSLAGGIVLTLWIGAARMVAGAHYLSDVLWAMVVMTVVAALLHRLLLHLPAEGRPQPIRFRQRWPALTAGAAVAVALTVAVLFATPYYREVALRTDRRAIGDGPWRLEVTSDRADVRVVLVPGAVPVVAVSGAVQGFGLPGVKVERSLHAESGLVRVEVAVHGWWSERAARLEVRVDPAGLAAVAVDNGDGAVDIVGPPELPRPALQRIAAR